MRHFFPARSFTLHELLERHAEYRRRLLRRRLEAAILEFYGSTEEERELETLE